VGILAGTFAIASGKRPAQYVQPTHNQAPPAVPTSDLCKTPGIRFNIDGQDAFAPVVRVRGSFCLPAFPANPNDTGP
jgi:hypothetical protein